MEKPDNNHKSFSQKVWITVAIVALVTCTLLLFKSAFAIFLLILAGVLIACFFRGFGNIIQRLTKWKYAVSLTVSVLFTFLLFGGIFYLIGAKIYQEGKELVEIIPELKDTAKEYIDRNEFLSNISDEISQDDVMEKAQPLLNSFFKSGFGLITDLYIIAFLGVIFTISPKVYQDGIAMLVPAQGRAKTAELLEKIGMNMKNWLKGMLISMLMVTVLTAIGLLILGVPMWTILAIIAGLLSFIPNFGPVLALIPAVLVALTVSPTTALLTVAMYLFVQLLESSTILPLVQQRLIHLPPALIIISQVFMGVWTGGWGVILAVPILVIVVVVVDELYVKKQNKKAAGISSA